MKIYIILFICILYTILIILFYKFEKNAKLINYLLINKRDFNLKLNKELMLISKYYKIDGMFINCRKNLSSTTYSKHKKIKISLYKISHYTSVKISKKKKILVAIHTHSSLFYQRYVFRTVYKEYNNLQLFFFVSKSENTTINYLLYTEMNLYKDIILFNFIGTYNNLYFMTYNFLLWLYKYKDFYEIVVKQDTDTFLNINLLNKTLESRNVYKHSCILGKIWYYGNKKKMYPSGMSYVVSTQALENMKKTIKEKRIELYDGYPEDKLMGDLARESNITFYDIERLFKYRIYLSLPKTKINTHNTLMIHSLKISEIAFLHYISINKSNYVRNL